MVSYSAQFAVFLLDNTSFPHLKLHLCMKMEVDCSTIKGRAIFANTKSTVNIPCEL